ncbi:MAG: hypothetical protein Q4P32_13300 [Micrococcales bacterium]|nr:hypothetical protein [Micrococcales bacterium]
MTDVPKPRRPTLRDSAALDAMAAGTDPVAELHAAHETAAVLLGVGRAGSDAEVTKRLMTVVDDVGITTLADLWATRPARSLPGVLYRLYVMREWVVADPSAAAREYAAGVHYSEPNHAVAGADPTGPDEVRSVIDDILRGAFDGDFGLAMERAAAFARVVSAGRDFLSRGDGQAPERLMVLADDLAASARLWRSGSLD